jgi:hypothetical protein
MNRLRRHSGIAVLEFAVSATFLLFLVTAGFGLIDYVRRIRMVNETIDNSLIDDGVKPLTLSLSDFGSAVTLRTSALEGYLREVVQKTSSRLLPIVTADGQQASGLYIEAAYAQLDIDPATGTLIRVESLIIPESARFGSLSIPGDLAFKTDLNAEFSRLAAQQVAGESSAALYAIPSGSFGAGNISQQYLSKSVLVGIRAFLSLKGGLAGSFMPLVGNNPVVYGIKAIALRGEFE